MVANVFLRKVRWLTLTSQGELITVKKPHSQPCRPRVSTLLKGNKTDVKETHRRIKQNNNRIRCVCPLWSTSLSTGRHMRCWIHYKVADGHRLPEKTEAIRGKLPQVHAGSHLPTICLILLADSQLPSKACFCFFLCALKPTSFSSKISFIFLSRPPLNISSLFCIIPLST